MFSTDGRFFTLDCAKLPGGRGNGETDPHLHRPAIRRRSGGDVRACARRKLLVASTSGHGFITGEDDAVDEAAHRRLVVFTFITRLPFLVIATASSNT